MSTQTEQTIVEKVRAILDRANHPNTPPAEAETALALAQKLITKYNIDESALAEARMDDEAIIKDEIVITGKWALRRVAVASAVARANSVSSYRTTHYEERVETLSSGQEYTFYDKDGMTLVMYGTAKDIFATKVLWQAVESLALRTIPKGDKSFRNSWWHGFASGISRALHRATAEAVRETGGNALVLADRYKRAEQERNANVRLKTTYSAGARRSDAYSHGQQTGASFSTGGVGRGAIGALGR